MTLSLVSLVAAVILGILVWRRGRDPGVGSVSAANGLRIAALVALGLQAALFLVFGIGEMLGGDLSGAMHLLPVALIAALAWLTWARPLEGGIMLILSGLASAIVLGGITLSNGGIPENSLLSPGVLLVGLPQIIAGALFLAAGLTAHKAHAGSPTHA